MRSCNYKKVDGIMSKIALSLKIDVSKIDKARLFKGAKGTYLDATIFVDLTELDQYGKSGMITQDVSKQEKAQNVKGNILGNSKIFWVEGIQAPQAQGMAQQAPQQSYNQEPQQQGGFAQVNPAGGFYPQQAPQQAQKVNPQEPVIDFDDSIPF